MIIPPQCPDCGTKTIIAKNINRGGAPNIYFWCEGCKRIIAKKGLWISKSYFTEQQIENIPTLNDYRTIETKCQYWGCTELSSEVHHIAPRYIFDDQAELFPKVNLCLKHHRQWHDTVDRHYGKPERKSYD